MSSQKMCEWMQLRWPEPWYQWRRSCQTTLIRPFGETDTLGKPKRKKVFSDGVAYEATKILEQNIQTLRHCDTLDPVTGKAVASTCHYDEDGNPVVDERFDGGVVPAGWTAREGAWSVSGGRLVGGRFVDHRPQGKVGLGGDPTTVRGTKGMDDLARLLARPGVEVHCLELVGAEPEELLKKLYDPLVRRLKADLWLDRERRGALTDRWR